MLTRRTALAAFAASSVSAPAVVRAQTVNWIAYSYVPAATLAARSAS